MHHSLSSRPFGSLPDGRPVEAWTLIGSGDLTIEVITYGGIVTRLLAPDRYGRPADVVLGFNALSPYLGPQPYLGAIAGRVAGRITNARFTLDGQTYRLAANDAPNHLHGGLVGFDKRLWSAEPVTRPDGAPSLRLTLQSSDGDQGYPGKLDVAVTYTVTADNAFLFETQVSTDRATPVSLTHHGYFNLAGEGAGDVLDHLVEITAETYVPTDSATGLLGRHAPVTPANDFRRPRVLREALPRLFQQHGDLYLNRRAPASPGAPVLAARVIHPSTGRVLTVTTTEDYLQFYGGAVLDGTLIGKSARPYLRHGGLCLECEGYPDGANTPALGDIILRPGQIRRHLTAYHFTTSP